MYVLLNCFGLLIYYFNNFFRPTIKELLDHEFFAEDLGLKLEIIDRDQAVTNNSPKIVFRLRVTEPNKRTKKYKENEAVQFDFDLNVDNAKEIASDMVCGLKSELIPVVVSMFVLLDYVCFNLFQAGSGHIFEDDVHFVVQMMNSRINSYLRDCKAMQLTKMMSMMAASSNINVPINVPPEIRG